MPVPKVLVMGAVRGQLEKAFQKITKLHLKQNFSFTIVVGDLFSSSPEGETESEVKSLLNGSIKVPLPTYFSVGDHSIPLVVQERLEASGEVCPNLFYLGRKGTLKTTEGIRIVNLGGRLVQNEASLTQAIGKYDPLYTDSDSRSLHGAHSADILITNQWPTGITKNSQIAVPDSIDLNSGTQTIANLCLTLKPRYHFTSSPSAGWSREPFMIPASVKGRQLKSYEDLDGSVTRFSSVASIQAPNKECLSAFNLDPTTAPSKEGAQQTCPLITAAPAKRKHDTTENHRFSHNSHNDQPRHGKRRKGPKDPAIQKECFMCASNASFDDKMLVSIAEDSMLTVLKGPLPIRGTTFPQLNSSGHILIIPMYHAADEAAHGRRTQEDMQREYTEMTRYRHSLQQMLGSKGLGAVTWEVNRTGIRHFHWQLIACQAETIKSGLVEAAYKIAAEKYKIRSTDEKGHPLETPVHFTPCDPDTMLDSRRSDFFRVWTWYPDNPSPPLQSPVSRANDISNGSAAKLPESKGTAKSMFFGIPSDMSFNIAFGREVMAGLLQLEDRSDWRVLESGHGLEDADAEAWQDEFQRPLGDDGPSWDFAMDSA